MNQQASDLRLHCLMCQLLSETQGSLLVEAEGKGGLLKKLPLMTLLKLRPTKVRENLVDLGLGHGITLLEMKLVIHSILELNVIGVGLVMLVIHIKMALVT
ncbi:uncharacterized protein DS421_11g331840 [Arachis hypogaea]|nr:uncharacterized protein DS421_11g331840 [Arachis hypogaea]